MENVIDLTAMDKPFDEQTEEIISEPQDPEAAEPPRERSEVETRGGMRILMTITAVCGAAAGALAAITGKADSRVIAALGERLSGSFGEIFLHRALSGGAILLAEFLLGFFAFGDFISWILPVFAGMGAGFFIAAAQKPVFLPSELAVLFAVIFAGASSAMFSKKLFGLSRGNRASLRGMTASEYSARFALTLLLIIAAAVYEGIAATTFGK